MKRALLLGLTACLVLSACLPRASPRTPDLDPATLSTAVEAGFTTVRFDPKTQDVVNVSLELIGDGLVVSTSGCEVSGAKVRCAALKVPGGKIFKVPFVGALERSSVVYFRPDGSRHTKEWPP